MAAESDGGRELTVPPSIKAVISERLDRLPREERSVIECAAVTGKQFLRGAIVDICPTTEQPFVGPALRELVRKDLVRPDVSFTGRDDGYRFGHVLIRDVAYEAMPKELRAELHERSSDWIEQNAGERALELEEIAAYHLEQAHRFRRELGAFDERTRELGRRAASLQGRAGRRAFAKGDMPAAVSLLARAVELGAAGEPGRPLLLTELGSALMKTGQFERAGTVLDEAIEGARVEGDRVTEIRATIERQFQRSFASPEGAAREDRLIAEAAIQELDTLDDPVGLAKAWWLLSEAHGIAGRWGARAEALEAALAHARRDPDARAQASTYASLLGQSLLYGPTPVNEAIVRCEELRAETHGPAPQAALGTTLAALYAMTGRIEEGRSLFAESIAKLELLGLRHSLAARRHVGAQIELLAGDPEAAVRQLTAGYETLAEMGEHGVRSTLAGFLADILSALGALEEAEQFAAFTEHTAGAGDTVAQVLWRRARARLEARNGERESALLLAREAVDRAALTDYLDFRADTLLTLAEVLSASGDDGAAASALDEATRLYDQKGNIVSKRNAAELSLVGGSDIRVDRQWRR
jgi:tetratricopeptide (TPR) repeat protein